MRQRVLRNACTSLGQAVINALCLFLTYRVLLHALGPVQLGVWSILAASSSFVRIGDLGLANGIVKCVARALVNNDIAGVRNVMFTAAVLAIPLNTALVFLSYPAVRWVLAYSIKDPSLRAIADSILPFFLVALWFQMLTAIPQASLDGAQRFDLRNAVLSCGSVAQVVITWLLVPRFGLIGAAYSQVLFWLLVLVAIWTVAGIRVHFDIRHSHFERAYVRELVSYGWNCQLMLVCGLTQDPVTKGLLAHFAGMRLVGYYELASRLINSLRTLITAANQVMVPAVAHLTELGRDRVSELYSTWFPTMLAVSMPIYACTVAAAPLISLVWIGQYSDEFVRLVCIAALGGAVNAAGLPVYFLNLGTGRLRWNTTAHVVIACLTPVLAFTLGWRFGGYGVVAGATTAIAIGTAVMIFAQERITTDWKVMRRWAPVTLVLAAACSTWATGHNGRYLPALVAVPIIASLGLLVGWQWSSLPLVVNTLRMGIARRAY